MSRIKGIRSSAALMVAVVALVAALGGGAVAGVTISKLNKKEKKQVKQISKKQARKLDKKIELTPGPKGDQGDPGQKGDQGDPGQKGDQGDPGDTAIKGQGDLTSTSEETILSVPEIDLEVRTDGDVDDDKQVRLYNTSPEVSDSMGQLNPGSGNASVILGNGDFGVASAPGAYAALYLDAGGDPDSYTPESSLDEVLQKDGIRVWLECVFPLDEVMCTAVAFP